MSKSVKKAIQNSFLQIFGAFGVTGLNFILMLGYARILGPSRLGELTTAQAHVLVWLSFVDLGLSSAMIGALTAAENGKGEFARQGFRTMDIVIRVFALRIIGVLVACIGILFLACTRNRVEGVLQMNLFWQDVAFLPHLFALALQHTAVSYATFRGRQGLGMFAMIIATALTVALPLYLAWQGSSIAILLLSQCWGGFLSTLIIVGALLFHRKFNSRLETTNRRMDSKKVTEKNLKKPWAMAAWKSLWQDAWPYALTYAGIVLWQRLDQITVAEFLGNEHAGQYALAIRLAAIPILIATSITHGLFPDLQRVGMDAPEKISLYIGVVTKLVFRYGFLCIGLCLLLIYFVIAPLVPKFQIALLLLPWFIPGIWCFWLQTFIMSGLFGLRIYKKIILCYLFSIVIYCISLVPLAKIGGLVGIAWASNLFPIALFLFSFALAKREGILSKKYSLYGTYSEDENKVLQPVLQKWRFYFGKST